MSLTALFNQYYATAPQGIASAPGRVNLIGEFTDYNLGYVLPCALEFRTRVAFRATEDQVVTVRSTSYADQQDSFAINTTITAGDSQWGNYIRAVLATLQKNGFSLTGAELLIDSNVPQGAGLSSSAALEVAIAEAFNQMGQLGLNATQMALIGQQAENEFMHCQCGIMDQLVSAKGELNHALLIDCNDLSTKSIRLPNDKVLMIINSNFPRKLVDSEYNQRRLDCENAAKKLNVSSLRHATMELLEQHQAQLTTNEFKRARHVITENDRVLAMTQALADDDFEQVIQLLAASHQSLHHDFKVTVPATDGIVNLVNAKLQGKVAIRMTGGGFGGAVVCFTPAEHIETIKQIINEEYPKQFDLHADIFVCETGEGVSSQLFSTATV